MTPCQLELLVCPACRGKLGLRAWGSAGSDVQTGTFTCSACVAAYPIVRGIARFVGQEWYSRHYEWKKQRYWQLLRWFREAGFSDPYIPDEPICVRGQKVPAP